MYSYPVLLPTNAYELYKPVRAITTRTPSFLKHHLLLHARHQDFRDSPRSFIRLSAASTMSEIRQP